MKKVNMIVVDGMRPDALMRCGNPYVPRLLAESAYTLEARTVFPPVTLPCHMSLFYSIEPGRHGVTDNIFTPMARPVKGIMEALHGRRTTAMAYDWEPLRDLCRPGNNDFGFYVSIDEFGMEQSTREVCAAAEKLLETKAPDFCFTYFGWVDAQGHDTGWMSGEYLRAVDENIGLVRRLVERTAGDYITILLADHGGHDRTHGLPTDEDMTIPVVIHGEGIRPGKIEAPVSILDIAPTVAKLLDCEPAKEWEGRPLV